MFIALLALAVLLFVRYVYLAILLIVLPFAWLMWVFPKFSGQFSKWWDNFIKWTLFPAVALFFMYLVILTLQNAATLPAVSPTAATDPSNPASTFLNATNNVNGGSQGVSFLQQALDDLALAALMIGGLFAAESLTGSIGKTAVSTAKSAAGWVGGVAGKATARQGKKVAARAVPEGLRNKLQSGQLGGIGRSLFLNAFRLRRDRTGECPKSRNIPSRRPRIHVGERTRERCRRRTSDVEQWRSFRGKTVCPPQRT